MQYFVCVSFSSVNCWLIFFAFFFSVGVIFLLLICRGFFLYIVEMSPLLFFYIKNICLHFLSCVHVSFFRQKFSFFDVIIVFAVAFVFVDS